MRRPLLIGLVLAMMASAAPVLAEENVWRLFVADHGEPVVTAIDLGSGDRKSVV